MNVEKIAIICPANYPVPAVKGGAIETLIEQFLNENEKYKRYEIFLYSYFDENALVKSQKYNNTKFIYLKDKENNSKILKVYRKVIKKVFKIDKTNCFLNEVSKNIKKENINKIIVEGNKWYIIPLKQSLKHKEIYLHIHHDAFSDNNNLNKQIIACCKKVITVSNYITNQTTNKSFNSNNKVVTLKNCTNTDIFNNEKYLNKKSDFKIKYNINKNEKVILFTGRILKIKGVKELILAFKKYCLDLEAKLIIVGNAGFGCSITNQYDIEVSKLAQSIGEKVIFTGFIHNNELPLLHSISDIAVVPSLWQEPAGLVVIEAMASGLPLIVTNVGGIPEYTDKKCSLIIENDDKIIDNLGSELRKLILSNEKRIEMSKQSRAFALEYNTENYYKNFIKILES